MFSIPMETRFDVDAERNAIPPKFFILLLLILFSPACSRSIKTHLLARTGFEPKDIAVINEAIRCLVKLAVIINLRERFRQSISFVSVFNLITMKLPRRIAKLLSSIKNT